ncbi:response regulator transcription factor [Dactylosporangium sucinum]
MLQVASAIGTSFGLLDLARLMRCGTASLLPALDEALQSGILVVKDDLVAFSSVSAHQVVEASLLRPVAVALREELLARGSSGGATVGQDHPDGGRPPPNQQETGLARQAGTALLPSQAAEPFADQRLGYSAGQRRPGGWESLTEREIYIAGLVGKALTNQQIAHRIGISRHTVNYHLRRIFSKLGIVSRVELASAARERQRSTA